MQLFGSPPNFMSSAELSSGPRPLPAETRGIGKAPSLIGRVDAPGARIAEDMHTTAGLVIMGIARELRSAGHPFRGVVWQKAGQSRCDGGEVERVFVKKPVGESLARLDHDKPLPPLDASLRLGEQMPPFGVKDAILRSGSTPESALENLGVIGLQLQTGVVGGRRLGHRCHRRNRGCGGGLGLARSQSPRTDPEHHQSQTDRDPNLHTIATSRVVQTLTADITDGRGLIGFPP